MAHTMAHSANSQEAAIIKRIAGLPFLAGRLTIEKVNGGITNINYSLSDASARYLVRIGNDIKEHHLMRFNELAASRAAHEAGLSPAVIHAEDGLMVLEFIKSRALKPSDVRQRETLDKIVRLLKTCHRDVAAHLRGPVLAFWVFHLLADYCRTLDEANSPYASLLAELAAIANSLEQAAGPYDIVFAHNDLLAANFLDDGNRLWLIDWDYAGFNTPLFDLGSLAANNDFDEKLERVLLESYFDAPVKAELWRRYLAMKTAALLRETMWSMVSEISSGVDFDFARYTSENLKRFRLAHQTFRQT